MLKCQYCPQARFSLQRDRNYHEKTCPLRPKSGAASTEASSLTDRNQTMVDTETDDDATKNESDTTDVDVIGDSQTDLREMAKLKEKRLYCAEPSSFDRSAVALRRDWKSKSASLNLGEFDGVFLTHRVSFLLGNHSIP